MTPIGKYIDTKRQAAGLSVSDLARLICIEPRTLWKSLRTGRKLQPDELIRIMAALKISVRELRKVVGDA